MYCYTKSSWPKQSYVPQCAAATMASRVTQKLHDQSQLVVTGLHDLFASWMQVLLLVHPLQCVLHASPVRPHPLLDWGCRAAAAFQPAAEVCAGQDSCVPYLLAGGAAAASMACFGCKEPCGKPCIASNAAACCFNLTIATQFESLQAKAAQG